MPAFRIIDRYIFKEVALAWIAVTGVLLVILMFNQLSKVLAQAAANQYAREVVLQLLTLTSLQNLSILVPVGFFLAIMLALGRFYHESEMAAMQACGIGAASLYRPIAVLGVVVAALLTYLSFVAGPAAFARQQEIRAEAARRAQLSALDAGKFRSFGGDITFYAESVDDQGVLHNVFAERTLKGKPGSPLKIEVMTAARAEQREGDENVRTLVLYDGQQYEGVPGSAEFRIIRFGESQIQVKLPAANLDSRRRERKPTSQLLGSSDVLDQAELQWRLSFPVMALVLMIIAVPLARLKPRQGRYGKMAIAFLVYFLYMMAINTARPWIEKDVIPAALGMWWVHAVMLTYGLWLVRDRMSFRRRSS